LIHSVFIGFGKPNFPSVFAGFGIWREFYFFGRNGGKKLPDERLCGPFTGGPHYHNPLNLGPPPPEVKKVFSEHLLFLFLIIWFIEEV
jgi:hypothetical protein